MLIFAVIEVCWSSKRVKKRTQIKTFGLFEFSTCLMQVQKLFRNFSDEIEWHSNFLHFSMVRMFILVARQKRVKFFIYLENGLRVTTSERTFTVILYMGRQKSGFRVTVSKRMFTILLNIARSIIYREMNR